MSPKEAKVFIVEDEPEWRGYYRRSLKRAGHQVVLTATTLLDALNKIEHLKRKGVQVAVIDGNLEAGKRNGSDGQRVVEVIKINAPSVKMVGMSGAGNIPGVDVNLGKANISKLGKTVTNL